MNRDEMRNRAPELPPELFTSDDGMVRWAAPIDGKAGGTWIGLNSYGVAACLLNAYPQNNNVARRAASQPSRGRIVPAVLSQGGLDNALAWIEQRLDPSWYEAFHLLLVSLEETAVWLWTGTGTLEHSANRDNWAVIVSSGTSYEAVAWRRQAFDRWLQAGREHRGRLPTFHLMQAEGFEHLSPLMDSERASTRSITQIAVELSERRCVLYYWPRLPGWAVAVAPSVEISLPLRH